MIFPRTGGIFWVFWADVPATVTVFHRGPRPWQASRPLIDGPTGGCAVPVRLLSSVAVGVNGFTQLHFRGKTIKMMTGERYLWKGKMKGKNLWRAVRISIEPLVLKMKLQLSFFIWSCRCQGTIVTMVKVVGLIGQHYALVAYRSLSMSWLWINKNWLKLVKDLKK